MTGLNIDSAGFAEMWVVNGMGVGQSGRRWNIVIRKRMIGTNMKRD